MVFMIRRLASEADEEEDDLKFELYWDLDMNLVPDTLRHIIGQTEICLKHPYIYCFTISFSFYEKHAFLGCANVHVRRRQKKENDLFKMSHRITFWLLFLQTVNIPLLSMGGGNCV